MHRRRPIQEERSKLLGKLALAGGLALLGGDGGEFAILHALPEQKESRVGVVGVRHDAPLPREIERHRP